VTSSRGRPAAWRGVVALLSGLVLATLTGCPAPVDRAAERTEASPAPDARPARPTEASTGLPVYEGPPPGGPTSGGPLTTVRAAVDLTPGAPAFLSRAVLVTAAPDGGAHVVLRPEGRSRSPLRLVTVAGPAGGHAVTGSVPMTGVWSAWGVHALPDGTVAVTGVLKNADERVSGPGVTVVDPGRRVVRDHVAVRIPGASGVTVGRSTLSADRRTVYLFMSEDRGASVRERLIAVDVATGAVRAERPLGEDVGSVSVYAAGTDMELLAARPDGGVTVAFDAVPETGGGPIPTLLTYDAELRPVGEAVRAASLTEAADIQAATAAPDGTVFLLVSVRDGSWVLAVPDRGGAGPVLVQLPEGAPFHALFVEPAQVWGLLPDGDGVRPVDFTTGDLGAPLDLGCTPSQEVSHFVPGAGGGALVLGACDLPRQRTPTLWILGP
jgi:hypothetical protein